MAIRLSKRLQCVADLAEPCECVVDVGTDHAYLPIYLLQIGKADQAAAADVAEGPLERAREHIEACGLSGRIRVVKSDGLCDIRDIPADSILILAGMGGRLMTGILMRDLDKAASFRELILEPQSEQELLRSTLSAYGFEICREEMVEEDGKYYPVLRVLPPSPEMLRERKKPGRIFRLPKGSRQIALFRYGKVESASSKQTLRCYLEKQKQEKENVLRHLESVSPETYKARKRKAELRDDLRIIREAMKQTDGGTA